MGAYLPALEGFLGEKTIPIEVADARVRRQWHHRSGNREGYWVGHEGDSQVADTRERRQWHHRSGNREAYWVGMGAIAH